MRKPKRKPGDWDHDIHDLYLKWVWVPHREPWPTIAKRLGVRRPQLVRSYDQKIRKRVFSAIRTGVYNRRWGNFHLLPSLEAVKARISTEGPRKDRQAVTAAEWLRVFGEDLTYVPTPAARSKRLASVRLMLSPGAADVKRATSPAPSDSLKRSEVSDSDAAELVRDAILLSPLPEWLHELQWLEGIEPVLIDDLSKGLPPVSDETEAAVVEAYV